MPCDICNHTVQNISAEGQRIFWCPRCGSLKTETGDFHRTTPPRLVGYVRDAAEDTCFCYEHIETRYSVPSWEWVAACEAVGRAGAAGGGPGDRCGAAEMGAGEAGERGD